MGGRHSIGGAARAAMEFYQADDMTRCEDYVKTIILVFCLYSSLNIGIQKRNRIKNSRW